MTEPAERHLSQSGLESFLEQMANATVPVAGVPKVLLQIEPAQDQIALDVAWSSGAVTVLNKYAHMNSIQIHRDGEAWTRISVRGRQFIRDAYPVLCSIADRVQEGGEELGDAVESVLDNYRALLDRIERLSPQHEVGLVGELVFLHHLIAKVGADDAVDAWLGPAGEEHDFGLESDDVEVKTTTTESRQHWIGSVTQLVPSPARSLWLVSIQLTAAGAAGGGITLPEVAQLVHERLDVANRSVFEHHMSGVGYRTESASLYSRRFIPRSRPAAFLVDDAFPRITPQLLKEAGVGLERLPEINYKIDLTDLPVGDLLVLDDFTFPEGQHA